METGTLKELNVKPGDVVESLSTNSIFFSEGKHYVISSDVNILNDEGKWWNAYEYTHPFRITSRAAQHTPDLTAITTPFGLLDEATQEALRAHGGPYEWYASNGWQNVVINDFEDHMTYRLQPEATVENVSIDAWIGDSGGVYVTRLHDGIPVRVTFNRINGLIDLASYKVEAR